jgi:hypothetical protein
LSSSRKALRKVATIKAEETQIGTIMSGIPIEEKAISQSGIIQRAE